jgi:Protein of unknown function (DUF3040)
MPLSEYEQRVLEQMERQLTSDDPKFATSLQSQPIRPGFRWLIAGASLVVGLLLLVAGVSASAPWLGVVGFVTMFAGVAFALARSRRQGPTGVVQTDGTVGARRQSRRAPGFMRRLEERWDQRRQEHGS